VIHEPTSKSNDKEPPYKPDRLEYLTGKALAGLSGVIHSGPAFVAAEAVRIALATMAELDRARKNQN
jgi:hypothetical protein